MEKLNIKSKLIKNFYQQKINVNNFDSWENNIYRQSDEESLQLIKILLKEDKETVLTILSHENCFLELIGYTLSYIKHTNHPTILENDIVNEMNEGDELEAVQSHAKLFDKFLKKEKEKPQIEKQIEELNLAIKEYHGRINHEYHGRINHFNSMPNNDGKTLQELQEEVSIIYEKRMSLNQALGKNTEQNKTEVFYHPETGKFLSSSPDLEPKKEFSDPLKQKNNKGVYVDEKECILDCHDVMHDPQSVIKDATVEKIQPKTNQKYL